jgi:hypothetical protein
MARAVRHPQVRGVDVEERRRPTSVHLYFVAPGLALLLFTVAFGMRDAVWPAVHRAAIDGACGDWPLGNSSVAITLSTADKLNDDDLGALQTYSGERANCLSGAASTEMQGAEAESFPARQWRQMRAVAFTYEARKTQELKFGVMNIALRRMTRPQAAN